MSQRMAVSVVSGVLLMASFAAAQTPPAPQAPEAAPRFVSGAEVVALDLVVRDKKGKLVTDLQEDGDPGAGGRRPPEADLLPRHSDGGPRRRAPRRPRPPPWPPRPRTPPPRRCGRDAAGRARLRPAQLRRSPARAVRGRGVRPKAGDAADGRDRRPHRRRPHSRAGSLLRPRRRQGGRAPGHRHGRGRGGPPRQHHRRGQQLLGPAARALPGWRERKRLGAGRERRPRQRAHHPRRGHQGRSGAQDRAAVLGGLLRRAGLRARVRRPAEPREPRQRELLRDRRARVAALDPARQHRQCPLEHRRDQRAERAQLGRRRGREPRGDDPGRHAPDEPALRRGRHPRQPLHQHGRLPRHPDERLRQAARPHRGGHPRLLRGLLRALGPGGAGAVPQDRGARHAQGRAGAVALRLLHDAAHGGRGVRGLRRGAAPGRLRGAQPLLPLRPRGRRGRSTAWSRSRPRSRRRSSSRPRRRAGSWAG